MVEEHTMTEKLIQDCREFDNLQKYKKALAEALHPDNTFIARKLGESLSEAESELLEDVIYNENLTLMVEVSKITASYAAFSRLLDLGLVSRAVYASRDVNRQDMCEYLVGTVNGYFVSKHTISSES